MAAVSLSLLATARRASAPVIRFFLDSLEVRSFSNADESASKLRLPFVATATKATTATSSDVLYIPYYGLMVLGAEINSLTGRNTGAFVVSHGPIKRLERADAGLDGNVVTCG